MRKVEGIFKYYEGSDDSRRFWVGQKYDGSKIRGIEYFGPEDVGPSYFVDIIKEDGTMNRIFTPDEVYFGENNFDLDHIDEVFAEVGEFKVDEGIEEIVEEQLPGIVEELFQKEIEKIMRRVFRDK